LKNLNFIIVASTLQSLEEFVIHDFISIIKNNIYEIPDIKLLVNVIASYNEYARISYDYVLDFRKTSFTQINKTVVLKGTGRKIFFLIENKNWRMSNLLKENKAQFIEKFVLNIEHL